MLLEIFLYPHCVISKLFKRSNVRHYFKINLNELWYISPLQSNADDEVGGDTEGDAVEGEDDLGEDIGVQGTGNREGPGKG